MPFPSLDFPTPSELCCFLSTNLIAYNVMPKFLVSNVTNICFVMKIQPGHKQPYLLDMVDLDTAVSLWC